MFFVMGAATSQTPFMKSGTINYTTSLPTGITKTIINNCFKTGQCSATPAGNIYMYPLPCSGSGTNPCTGCWSRSPGGFMRVGNLNGSNTCANGEYKVFLGYKMECPSGPSPCDNGRLLLGCEMERVGAGLYFKKDCFDGNAIVVDPTNMPQLCDAGKFRDSLGDCVMCAAGTYKAIAGESSALCLACPTNVPIMDGTTQAGTAGSPLTTGTGGWTSVDSCKYDPATVTCTALYDKVGDTCVKKACNLSMTYTSTNPDPVKLTKGTISAVVSGQEGTATTTLSPAGSGTSPNFTNLNAGTYILRTEDRVSGTLLCYRQASVILVNEPSCNLSLSASATKQPSNTTAIDGEATLTIGGAAGATTTTISPSGTFKTGYTASSKPTIVFAGLRDGTYTITVNDAGASCASSTTVTLSSTSNVCLAGQGAIFDGTGKKTGCQACASGFYKEVAGDVPCTACYRAPSTSMSITGYSSPVGSTLMGQCMMTWGCISPATVISGATYPTASVTSGNVGCQTATSPSCALSITSTVPQNPSSTTTTDGRITVNVSGAAGALTWTASSNAGLNTPAGGPGTSGRTLTSTATSATYAGLDSATHSITVTDATAGCSKTTSATLGGATGTPCLAVTKDVSGKPVPLPAGTHNEEYTHYSKTPFTATDACSSAPTCRSGMSCGSTVYPTESVTGSRMGLVTYTCNNGSWVIKGSPVDQCICKCDYLRYGGPYSSCSQDDLSRLISTGASGLCYDPSNNFCTEEGYSFVQGKGAVRNTSPITNFLPDSCIGI